MVKCNVNSYQFHGIQHTHTAQHRHTHIDETKKNSFSFVLINDFAIFSRSFTESSATFSLSSSPALAAADLVQHQYIRREE